jgi:hypothetical protein
VAVTSAANDIQFFVRKNGDMLYIKIEATLSPHDLTLVAILSISLRRLISLKISSTNQ